MGSELQSRLDRLRRSSALDAIRQLTLNTRFEGDLYLVGGAIRDAILGLETPTDFDLVTTGSAVQLAQLIDKAGLSAHPPVLYERFGTAMVRVEGSSIELVTARHESYSPSSRKPEVQPAGIIEDASRRDFTVNTLIVGLHDGVMRDPLGMGLEDLEAGVLRTPLDPAETFRDDPLRMLRAVRFRYRFGFSFESQIEPAISSMAHRLSIVSSERIRDEFLKTLDLSPAAEACDTLMRLGLFDQFLPEFRPMLNCEQGHFHHLDVWEHTLLVLRQISEPDRILRLAALFHDVGKPATRFVDDQGNIRFFGHEAVGASMTTKALTRLCLTQKEVRAVVSLVKNHMRLGTATNFSASAARRLVRDLDEQIDRLLDLVEADASSLKPGVRVLDLDTIRKTLSDVRQSTPASKLESPLTGKQIMDTIGCPPGPVVGRVKNWLVEQVIEGRINPDDAESARQLLTEGSWERASES